MKKRALNNRALSFFADISKPYMERKNIKGGFEMMKRFATREQVQVFNKLGDVLDEAQQDSICVWGSELYANGLFKGALMTFGCALIPVIIAGASYIIRSDY